MMLNQRFLLPDRAARQLNHLQFLMSKLLALSDFLRPLYPVLYAKHTMSTILILPSIPGTNSTPT